MIHEIETFLKSDIKRKLEDRYAANWYREGVPQSIYRDASTRAAEKQYEAEPGVVVNWWDCLYIVEYQKILYHGGQAVWQESFESTYTLPSDKKSNSWRSKLGWMNELNRIRNKVAHNETVAEEEYGFLQTLYSHFDLGGTGRND
jgi:DNA sulfur modification protein DndB